ncbi:MAG: hypothetical protein ACN4GT_03580, partial [Gammaproteobacteria bacterium]
MDERHVRHSAIFGLVWLPASVAVAQPVGKVSGSDDRLSQSEGLQPFARGDVFVGATQLNNPDDDHAGRGRILQYDADLHLKGVLWVEGTTHLVYGLTFAPDATLWAFDPWAWTAVRVTPDGQQLPNRQFAKRAFSMVHFASDGTLLFTESLEGDNQPLPLTTRHPVLPGETSKLGDGDIYRFDADGNLLKVYDPEVHGGMSGSMGITHSVMSADGGSLIYVSETGSRLMRYDVVDDRQLPDVRSHAADERQMYFDLTSMSGERILISMGNRLDLLSESGEELRSYPLEGF